MPTNTTPQSVSRRYAHNLLARGSNRTFEIERVEQKITQTPGGLPCGFYYDVHIKRTVGFDLTSGEGMTPVEATVAALRACGVTFR